MRNLAWRRIFSRLVPLAIVFGLWSSLVQAQPLRLPTTTIKRPPQQVAPAEPETTASDEQPTEDAPSVTAESSADEPAADETMAAESSDAVSSATSDASYEDPTTQASTDTESSDAQESASDKPAHEKPKLDPARFKGIRPGESARADLRAAWGAPHENKRLSDGSSQLVYKMPPFKSVVCVIREEIVVSIVIHLDKPIAPADLARQLRIEDGNSVVIHDDHGVPLGEAFPERGVLFGFSPLVETPQVLQVIIEPLDPQAFVLRAEMNLEEKNEQSLADVDVALQLSPKHARAHHVRSRVLQHSGEFEGALRSAQDAVAAEPENPDYRLQLALLEIEMSDFVRAEDHAQEIIANKQATPIVKAKARCVWGDALAGSAQPDFAAAMQQHLLAIKLAEPLGIDRRPAMRRAAKEILVEAHLDVAHDIGCGRWQQKQTVVPKWIDRATAFAENLHAEENADESAMWQVHVRALAALAVLPEPTDPSQHVGGALQLGEKLMQAAGEGGESAKIAWRLGLALDDAAQIERNLGHGPQAQKYGEQAITFLQHGAAASEQLPTHSYRLGQAYYHLGVVAAVEQQDHGRAVGWYEKAIPLLEAPVPNCSLTDTARQGEMFVSMAVSHWENGAREEGLRLARQGVKLMEQAVDDGLADRTVLSIPYGNLAAMHKDLGETAAAERCAALAKKYDPAAKQK